MAKEYWSEKKKWETWTYFKCDKKGHIAKDYKGKQMMKKWKVQERSDNKDDKKKEGFGDNLK